MAKDQHYIVESTRDGKKRLQLLHLAVASEKRSDAEAKRMTSGKDETFVSVKPCTEAQFYAAAEANVDQQVTTSDTAPAGAKTPLGAATPAAPAAAAVVKPSVAAPTPARAAVVAPAAVPAAVPAAK